MWDSYFLSTITIACIILPIFIGYLEKKERSKDD